MLKCILKIKSRGKRRKHTIIPKTHKWKAEGKISPSRRTLGTADFNSCKADVVLSNQKHTGLKGKL
jgi:hypothetical protein